MRCAATSGAVSCRVVSCRIRPASRAVEWEQERGRRPGAAEAMRRCGDGVQRRRDMRRWVRCEFRSRARDGARDAGVSGGVLEW
jgi:hypothetical protein